MAQVLFECKSNILKLIHTQWGNPGFFKSKSNDLKLNCKISPLYVTLMNDLDNTFVLAFYNSFLKVACNCDQQ